MCLTIPGKIKSIKNGRATVQNSSRTAQIELGLVLDAKVGDWVLYATDRAVKSISEEDAREIIKLLEDHYHPVDVSKLSLEFKKIIIKVRSGNHNLSISEIEYLLNLKGKDNLETLYAEANSIRKERIEDFVCIHGIIEFSNYCKNNCLYCGIRRDNNEIERYRMTEGEIVNTTKTAVDEEGYKLLVLQSGEDSYYTDAKIIRIIKEIKRQMRVFVFISVGERSKGFYEKAYKAGASGSLYRFETSNSLLYEKMHPKHKLNARMQCLRDQINIGYYMASGNLVGLPGQTTQDLAYDLLVIKKLGLPMISAGPFIPSSNTPLERGGEEGSGFVPFGLARQDEKKPQRALNSAESIELFLKYIAVARFLMPEVKIPVTTALETLDPENGRHRGLLAGANALMFNLTPEKFAGNYSIYDHKYREREKVWQKYGLFSGEESYEMLEDRLMI